MSEEGTYGESGGQEVRTPAVIETASDDNFAKKKNILGLGRIIYSIDLQDLYIGMALQGLCANYKITNALLHEEIVSTAIMVGKKTHEQVIKMKEESPV